MPAPAATEPIELGGEPFRLTDPAPDSPAYPYPGDSADGDEPPTGGSARTRRIVLNTLLAVGLAGAAVLGYTAWRIGTQKDATLTAPAQVAGLRMDNTENGRSTAEYLATAISADVDLDQTVGAVYTDPAAADRSVLFFGGTTLIWTPESDLDTAFNLISDDQGSVSGLHQVGAGDLGGTMKCGTTSTGDGDITVCGWADHGSLALAMFPNRDEAESADLLRQIRSAAQTRA